MKSIKKRILSFTMIAALVLSINIPVHAEWKQVNNLWTYTDANGSLKTGWLENNQNWYYFNSKGTMITSWVIDKGNWYYMRENGSLNNSKTTSNIPLEIQKISNIIKPFAGDLRIEYAGMGSVKDNDGFNNYGIENQYVLLFKAYDKYGANADFLYVYDPYNCRVFKLQSDLTIKLLGQGNATNTINESQAIQNVKSYLIDNNISVPSKLAIEQNENNTYKIHCYDDMGDHTATIGWYYVDKSTGYVVKM